MPFDTHGFYSEDEVCHRKYRPVKGQFKGHEHDCGRRAGHRSDCRCLEDSEWF